MARLLPLGMPRLYNDLGVITRDIREMGLPTAAMRPKSSHHGKRADALQLHFLGDMLTVRLAIQRALQTPLLLGLGTGERERLEIVLAEALNNIVEHAYAQKRGKIRLAMWNQRGRIHLLFEDEGCAMPEGGLPKGDMPESEQFPEGGFGWYLIRSFSQRVSYRRIDGFNRLYIILKRQQ